MATETPTKPGSEQDNPDELKPGTTPHNTVQALADKSPDEIKPVEGQTATDWFLSSDKQEVAWAYLPINVAPAGSAEQIVNFKIQVVDRDEIKALRKRAERKNPDGTTEVDDMEANLQLAVAGLLEPDMHDPKMLKVRGQEFVDPADALRARFAHKPGLIDQIATKITQISGYDDKDVKEVRAAGN